MQAIYTRTMKVKDNSLGEAMEVGKSLAKVRKKYYPKHNIYFSFQIGGNPRTIRETLIGPMFEGDNEADAKMSADKKYQSLQRQLKKVAVEGTIEDEIRVIFSE
ncbi:hypothetical protein [Candidatus Pelagibacter bacterium nBUS_36]|uniref:hypothetical protein n=1 Tax=Candidatus Pelagibacter bacterium nBUS_36 TaxID=3374194 RepID=UPI003EBF77EE